MSKKDQKITYFHTPIFHFIEKLDNEQFEVILNKKLQVQDIEINLTEIDGNYHICNTKNEEEKHLIIKKEDIIEIKNNDDEKITMIVKNEELLKFYKILIVDFYINWFNQNSPIWFDLYIYLKSNNDSAIQWHRLVAGFENDDIITKNEELEKCLKYNIERMHSDRMSDLRIFCDHKINRFNRHYGIFNRDNKIKISQLDKVSIFDDVENDKKGMFLDFDKNKFSELAKPLLTNKNKKEITSNESKNFRILSIIEILSILNDKTILKKNLNGVENA